MKMIALLTVVIGVALSSPLNSGEVVGDDFECCFPDKVSGTAYIGEQKQFRFYDDYIENQKTVVKPDSFLEPNKPREMNYLTVLDFNTMKHYGREKEDTQDCSEQDISGGELLQCLPENVVRVSESGRDVHYMYKDPRTNNEYDVIVNEIDANNTCIPIKATVILTDDLEKQTYVFDYDEPQDVQHEYFIYLKETLIDVCEEADRAGLEQV